MQNSKSEHRRLCHGSHDLEGVFGQWAGSADSRPRGRGKTHRAEIARARQRRRGETVKQKPRSGSFINYSAEPLYTAGHECVCHRLIRRAGGVSVTADVPGAGPSTAMNQRWPQSRKRSSFAHRRNDGYRKLDRYRSARQSPRLLEGRVYKNQR